MAVHTEFGPGFLEAVYQEAMEIELLNRSIPCRREVPLKIHYCGHILATSYRADFLCYESIVVEIKAISQLTSTHEAQLLNYLKATSHEVGLLLNFGAPSLEYRRMIRSS